MTAAERERIRIRRAQREALREMTKQARETMCVCRLVEFVGKAHPCGTCKAKAALKDIDNATRAPRPVGRKRTGRTG